MASWQSRFIQRLIRMSWDKTGGPVLEANRLRAREAKLATRFAKVPPGRRSPPRDGGPCARRMDRTGGRPIHRVIIYLHGGGYVMGSLDTHRNLVARLAAAASARVLFLNYRLGAGASVPGCSR